MMDSHGKPQVEFKFSLLINELEVEVQKLNAIGSEAFGHGRHDRAQDVLNQAKAIESLRDRIIAMLDEWRLISTGAESEVAEKPAAYKPKAKTRNAAHRETDSMTPESTYFKPILESLVARGGSSPVGPVLDDVHEKVKGLLNEVDYQRLPQSGEIRWRNKAKWARKQMVEDGRLKSGSPHGQWEISDLGRKWLEEQPD